MNDMKPKIPFNLQRAIAGDPVQAGNGENVEILRVIKTVEGDKLVALITYKNGMQAIRDYKVNGQYFGYCQSEYDLEMAPIKKGYWAMMHQHGPSSIAFTSEQSAIDYASALPKKPIRIIHVEWEE
jgi:hypothetical protein